MATVGYRHAQALTPQRNRGGKTCGTSSDDKSVFVGTHPVDLARKEFGSIGFTLVKSDGRNLEKVARILRGWIESYYL